MCSRSLVQHGTIPPQQLAALVKLSGASWNNWHESSVWSEKRNSFFNWHYRGNNFSVSWYCPDTFSVIKAQKKQWKYLWGVLRMKPEATCERCQRRSPCAEHDMKGETLWNTAMERTRAAQKNQARQEPKLCLWVWYEDTGKAEVISEVWCSWSCKVFLWHWGKEEKLILSMLSRLSFETHLNPFLPYMLPIQYPHVTWFLIFVLFHDTRFHFYIQLQTLEVFSRV